MIKETELNPPTTSSTIDLNSLSAKTTPVDADLTLIGDSVSSYSNKKLTWSNLKATLKTYLDTLYQATGLSLLKSNNLSDLTDTNTAKQNLSLEYVDNTADVNKPVSTAQATAIGLKVAKVTATDNAITRFDSTAGEVQNSGITIDDSNNITLPASTAGNTIGFIYKGAVKFIHNYFGNYAGLSGQNLFIGLNAGNTTSNGSVATYEASFNTAIGDLSMNALTTGYNNVALGYKALTLNTTGSNNFGLGAFSLEKVTTGGGNTAVGTESAEYTTGSSNTIVGKRAGQGVNASSTYSQTAALGFQALQALTTGGNNIAVGCYAGDLLTTGGNNIIIGYNIDPTGATVSNQLNIGGVLQGTGMYGTGKIGVMTAAPNSTLHTNGSFATGYVAKTGTYTATATDYIIDCTSGTFTVTLPTAVGITGRIYVIKNSGSGAITVGTTSSQTIDGVTTKSLATQYDKITVQSNGANWIILSN